ncbi:MAG: hypothetical protein Q4C20_01490 [Erysipelotrichaceae bacterium]|nr:hypothetical protein [Erysipelotrichaceae bacterium]
MKKLTIKKNTAAGILAGIMLTGCAAVNDQQNTETPDPSYEPADNQNAGVYGPAPAETSGEDNEQNQTETESGDYEPASNTNTAVYGPPPVAPNNSNGENGENAQP